MAKWDYRHEHGAGWKFTKKNQHGSSYKALPEISSLIIVKAHESKLRVVLLTTSFPLSRTSVSGVFVRRLVDALPATVDVEVVTPCATIPLSGNSIGNHHLRCFRYAPWKWQVLAHLPGGIPVALRRSRFSVLLVPSFLCAMFLAVLRTSRTADIVHANWSISGFVAAFACRLTGVPLITTIRGEDLSRAEGSRLYRFFLRTCMRHGRRVVAVGHAMGDRLQEMFPEGAGRIVVLPNGVSPRLLSLNAGQSGRAGPGGLRILVVGSLIPRKGVDTVINAIAKLPESDFKRLVVVGDGMERQRLQSLAREKGISGKVEFVGDTEPDQVYKYYEASDVFVLASHSEGRPNVLLEAMAAGLPVVATEINGVKELVTPGETGLLFQAGNAGDLARHLSSLSEDLALCASLAGRARQFIVDNQLLWASTGARYERLYQDVLRDFR